MQEVQSAAINHNEGEGFNSMASDNHIVISAAPRARFSNPWTIVFGAAISLAFGAVPIVQYTFGLFMQPLEAEFGWNRAELSLGIASVQFISIPSVLLVGWAMDRWGVRRVIGPLIFLFAINVALLSFTSSLVMFVGLYALFGVTSAGLNPIGYLKSISTFMHRRNGLAIGLALSGTAVGAAIVPNFAQFVISEYGWRSAYLILALLPALVALPFTLLFIREPTASSPASVGAVESAQLAPTNTLVGLTVREAFRTRSFWILASTLFLVSSVINGTIAHAVPYLVDQDYSPNDAASVLAGVGLASIVGRISSGYFFDRFFASHVAVFFFVLLIIGLYLLDSVQAPNIAMFCVGLTLGFEMDMIGYLVPRYFGLKKFGQIYALLFGTLNGGGAFGPLAMGGIYAWQGSYNLAFIGFGVMLMTACVLVLRLPAYPYQSFASKSG